MDGFRSLGVNEEVEFECKDSGKGLEATYVCGPSEQNCLGSTFRPKGKKRIFRKVRCYNCGEFANHVANQCSLGPMGKRCHNCKSFDHLVVDCPVPKVCFFFKWNEFPYKILVLNLRSTKDRQQVRHKWGRRRRKKIPRLSQTRPDREGKQLSPKRQTDDF